jgi:putative flippase GtrA
VNWRRFLGAALMILGGALAVAMIALAAVVIGNFVEWDNATDAMSTVATITAPPAALGLAFIAVGRWTYGDWTGSAPVRQAFSFAVRFAGYLIAFALGAMLLFLLFTGLAPDDQGAALVLGAGTAIGIGLVVLGLRIRPGRRGYLDD